MSTDKENPLQKLKDIANGVRTTRPDMLELRPEMIAAEDETTDAEPEDFEIDMPVDEDAPDTRNMAPIILPVTSTASQEDMQPGTAETRPEAASAIDAAVTSGMDEGSEPLRTERDDSASVTDLDDLLKGHAFPAIRLPLSRVTSYDLMNSALRDGRLRLDAGDGEPQVVLTDQSIRSLMDDEKRAASVVIDRVEKSSGRIADLEGQIAEIRRSKARDMETAARHSARIRQMQDLLEGK